jgi:hypothetical protein
VNDLLQMVCRLEQGGGALVLDGNNIRYRVPSGDVEAWSLLNELRKHREALRCLLRERESEQQIWPCESLESEHRFGQPHAKLFPFLGRKVRTPAGPGTLLQVFAHRVTVLLDSQLSKCTFFAPDEIEPVSIAHEVRTPFRPK